MHSTPTARYSPLLDQADDSFLAYDCVLPTGECEDLGDLPATDYTPTDLGIQIVGPFSP